MTSDISACTGITSIQSRIQGQQLLTQRRLQMIMRVLSLSLILLLTLSSPLTSMGFSAPKNIVVVGGGIQGTSVAYHLFKKCDKSTRITILESKEPAAAASGKGGGFMARSWGNGSPTQRLHELAFDLYPTICQEIGCTSYRKLPVLSVSPRI